MTETVEIGGAWLLVTMYERADGPCSSRLSRRTAAARSSSSSSRPTTGQSRAGARSPLRPRDKARCASGCARACAVEPWNERARRPEARVLVVDFDGGDAISTLGSLESVASEEVSVGGAALLTTSTPEGCVVTFSERGRDGYLELEVFDTARGDCVRRALADAELAPRGTRGGEATLAALASRRKRELCERLSADLVVSRDARTGNGRASCRPATSARAPAAGGRARRRAPRRTPPRRPRPPRPTGPPRRSAARGGHSPRRAAVPRARRRGCRRRRAAAPRRARSLSQSLTRATAGSTQRVALADFPELSALPVGEAARSLVARLELLPSGELAFGEVGGGREVVRDGAAFARGRAFRRRLTLVVTMREARSGALAVEGVEPRTGRRLAGALGARGARGARPSQDGAALSPAAKHTVCRRLCAELAPSLGEGARVGVLAFAARATAGPPAGARRPAPAGRPPAARARVGARARARRARARSRV